MGIKKAAKNLKGSVSIENYRNKIRLRWRYQSKRYTLNLFTFNPHNLLQAKKLAVTIENDLVTGLFDSTLEKYRTGGLVKTPPRQESIITLFEQWALEYKNRDCEKHINYHAVRNMMKRWEPFKASEILKKLNGTSINERTYNRRLTLLKGFAAWLVKQKITAINYLEDVQPKQTKKANDPKRKPFTPAEITLILDAVKDNKFCPKCSQFKHSHYYPFLYFIFKTGVRNAEAIGLRVQNVNYEKKVIEISEVLARSLKGTHASARIRKETKNGKIRQLPLTDDLRELLEKQASGKQGNDLVFTSPKGKAIDDRMFQRRIFRTVLEGLNIENRVLYACRHTFSSRCMESGLSPVTTAFLMGNNPETALKSYTHQLSLPENLPSIVYNEDDNVKRTPRAKKRA
jgi:integrase